MPEPSLKDLILTYKAAQLDVPLPEVTLVTGEFHFKIHGDLLTTKSLFSKRALEGNFTEASTKTINIEADPWIVARLVQFPYFGVYQIRNRHDDHTFIGRRHSMALSVVMKHAKHASSSCAMRIKDESRSPLDVAILMFNLGHMYAIDGLIASVTATIREASFDATNEPEKVLENMMSGITIEQMNEFPDFKKEVVRLIGRSTYLIESDVLYEGDLADPDVTLQIA